MSKKPIRLFQRILEAAHARAAGNRSIGASEGIKLQDRLIAEGDREALKKAVAVGTKYHKVDKAPWQKAMQPIYDNWASKVGGMEMIKAVQDTP